jgi:hypothetical protein
MTLEEQIRNILSILNFQISFTREVIIKEYEGSIVTATPTLDLNIGGVQCTLTVKTPDFQRNETFTFWNLAQEYAASKGIDLNSDTKIAPVEVQQLLDKHIVSLLDD